MTTSSPLTKEEIVRRLNLGGLIKDWGGFEKLVAELNLTGNVTVEHDVKLIGKSGATRQIDVLIRHQQGLIEHLVIVDCKYWRDRVSRAEVDALANTVREVNASRGVLFSVMGFESGAITQAKADGIELFTVRDLTDQEWGLPGRHVDFYLHIISKAYDALEMPGLLVGNLIGTEIKFDLNFGVPSDQSKHPLQPNDQTTAKTLEEFIDAIAQQAVAGMWKPEVLLDGNTCKRFFWKAVQSKFAKPIIVKTDEAWVMFQQLNFKLGLQIDQTRFQFDRGAKYAFVLAVHDEVRSITKAASRETGQGITTLSPLLPLVESRENGPVLTNGSIMSVYLRPPFDFAEIRSLEKGEYRDILK